MALPRSSNIFAGGQRNFKIKNKVKYSNYGAGGGGGSNSTIPAHVVKGSRMAAVVL